LQFATHAHADVYLGWSSDEVPVYSDRPQTGFVFFLGTEDLPTASPARRQPGNAYHAGMQRYSPHIAQVAAEYGLAPELLHAVVQVESGYNAQAVSPKGAVGLMQLMPATARRLGVADRRDPLANLRGGARYLRNLIGLFSGDLSLALAAYNAGEAAVQRHARRIPPYAETIAYVRAVQRRYELLTGRS
jgi:soluble lytic murein transglycosylase-like protein